MERVLKEVSPGLFVGKLNGADTLLFMDVAEKYRGNTSPQGNLRAMAEMCALGVCSADGAKINPEPAWWLREHDAATITTLGAAVVDNCGWGGDPVEGAAGNSEPAQD